MLPMNSRFREHYKKNVGLAAGAAKYKRTQQKLEERRVSRAEQFSRQRNLIGVIDDSDSRNTAVNEKKLKLQQWKAEKQRQKMLKKASEKPVFKCGVVHHNVGSPYLSDISNKFTHKCCTRKNNRVTNNKEQSFAPPNFKFKPPKLRPGALTAEGPRSNISDAHKGVLSTKSNNCFVQENSLRRVTRSQTRACNQPVQYNFTGVQKGTDMPTHKSVRTPKSKRVPKTETPEIKSNSETAKGVVVPKQDTPVTTHMNSEDSGGPSNRAIVEEPHTSESHSKCETVSTPVNNKCFPFQYSPFVTMHRGSSGRRSRLLKDMSKQNLEHADKLNDSSSLGTTASSSDALDQAYNNQHHGVLYFRTVVDNEVRRLEAMCQEWLHVQNSVPDLPPDASELISAAVGQTLLLLKKKFSQFCSLIDRCEKDLELETEGHVTCSQTEARVMCSDLEGFWDLVFLEVENVDIRFNKLQELKLNSWKEKAEAVNVKAKQPLSRGLKQSKVFKKQAQSSLRSMIMAARKKKQQEEASENTGGIGMNFACSPKETGVTSRVSICQPQTPELQHTLLQQNRRRSKRLSRVSSPIEKVTHMGERYNTSVPKVQFAEVADSLKSRRIPLPNQTPKKSILKSALVSPLKRTNTTVNNDDVSFNESRLRIRRSVRLATQAQD